MSKLLEYPEEQRPRIKAFFNQLLMGKVDKGQIEETDAGIQAAMPQAFMEACQVVVTVDDSMSRLKHYPEADQNRIRSIAMQLIEGQIIDGKVAGTEESIRIATREAVNDARQVVIAVEEYLCG